LNGKSRPSGERVPSGNIITGQPSASVSRHAASICCTLLRSPRRSGMSPPSRINQPSSGRWKISSLATQRMSHGSHESRNGSAVDS
jgi:hypothetical protein